MALHVMLFSSIAGRTRHRHRILSSRLGAALDQGRELACHPVDPTSMCGNPAKALPGHLIDDVEDTKAVAASELVVDEIRGD